MIDNIKLFIFDLDGVLTETSEQHFYAWRELARSIGIDFDREFNEKLKGISRMDSLDLILKHGGVFENYTQEEKEVLAKNKNDYYLELINEFTRDNLFEGVEELFIELRNRNIKIAIGSASKNAPLLIEKMGISQYIDYIVNPEQIAQGKPAPDTFLDAANYFNIDPKFCIGVEDAIAGVDAIKSANMFAIGIGEKDILVKADIVFNTTKDVSLDVL